MSEFVVVSLAPRSLNIHGDAENAYVLAARARWCGHEARVVEAYSANDVQDLTPNAIVIGSGFDSDATEVLDTLHALQPEISAWVTAGVPLLAVGLGWELLSAATELEPGKTTEGLGIFSGRFAQSERHVGPAALDSNWGLLTGYEYHYRDYTLGADEQALGLVQSGAGNSPTAGDARSEGAIRGNSFGTSLRGPILGRNPRLADAMLAEFGAAASSHEAKNTADEYAMRANALVRAELGLDR